MLTHTHTHTSCTGSAVLFSYLKMSLGNHDFSSTQSLGPDHSHGYKMTLSVLGVEKWNRRRMEKAERQMAKR